MRHLGSNFLNCVLTCQLLCLNTVLSAQDMKSKSLTLFYCYSIALNGSLVQQNKIAFQGSPSIYHLGFISKDSPQVLYRLVQSETPPHTHTPLQWPQNMLETILVIILQPKAVIPNLFGTKDWFCGRNVFHRPGMGDGFRMIQAHSTYCALYFHYHYISSTSDHQAIDHGGWGPLT